MADDREGRRVSRQPGKTPSAKLSAEERALWEHAAQSIAPIKGKKGRVHAALEDAESATGAAKREPAKHVPPKKGAALPAHASVSAKPAPAKPVPSPLSLERRKARKLSSGRTEIEGRIDLHGMRQSEAHTALRRFLMRSYADGKRWVLVITGKGAPQRTAHDERLEFEATAGRGILRRNVPMWLAEPELAPIVIGFTTAAANHGGEGALYIHLRKGSGRSGG